ncbi:hypothetical protein D3C72_1752870 [compost metagenome]
MFGKGSEQIVKRQAQPTVIDAVVQVVVGPQEQRDLFPGKHPLRQHFCQHATGPNLLLLRADDEHAAPPRGTGR